MLEYSKHLLSTLKESYQCVTEFHVPENSKFPIRANIAGSGVNLSSLLRDCKFEDLSEVISDL